MAAINTQFTVRVKWSPHYNNNFERNIQKSNLLQKCQELQQYCIIILGKLIFSWHVQITYCKKNWGKKTFLKPQKYFLLFCYSEINCKSYKLNCIKCFTEHMEGFTCPKIKGYKCDILHSTGRISEYFYYKVIFSYWSFPRKVTR